MNNFGMSVQILYENDCSGLKRLVGLDFGGPDHLGDATVCPLQGYTVRKVDESIISDFGYPYDQPTASVIVLFLLTNTLHMLAYDFATDTIIRGVDFDQCVIDFPIYLATEKVKENGQNHSDIYVTGVNDIFNEWENDIFNLGQLGEGKKDRQVWNADAIINAGTIENVDLEGDYSSIETANPNPKTQPHQDLIAEINDKGVFELGPDDYKALMHSLKNLTDPNNVSSIPQVTQDGVHNSREALSMNMKQVVNYYFDSLSKSESELAEEKVQRLARLNAV